MNNLIQKPFYIDSGVNDKGDIIPIGILDWYSNSFHAGKNGKEKLKL